MRKLFTVFAEELDERRFIQLSYVLILFLIITVNVFFNEKSVPIF